MALYKLATGGVFRGTSFIPADNAQRDYREYLAWVLAGNTADPQDPPTPPSALEVVESSAHTAAAAIPNWATWPEETALDYLNTNINIPLATPIPANPMSVQQIRAVLVVIVSVLNAVYIVLVALTRMIIAMRNKQWPDLQA